jgi:hypothetical protein
MWLLIIRWSPAAPAMLLQSGLRRWLLQIRRLTELHSKLNAS